MNIPVFLSSDDNYAPYMAATIVSVAENTNSYIDFYILDNCITEENSEKILSIIKKYTHCSIEFIKINSEEIFSSIKSGNEYCNHISISAFNRFLIPVLKPNLKKVIYLDSDIIANGDILNLYNHDLSSFALGAIPGQMTDISNICIELLGLSKSHKFFNSGVLLIDTEKFRDKNILKHFYEIEKEYREKILYLDQDILNVYFENNYLQLDKIFNYEAIENDLCDNFILRHYTTGLKPWLVSPNIKTDIIKNSDIFWYYLSKTPYYEFVANNCECKTPESMHKLRLQKLLEKHAGNNPEIYIKNKKKLREINEQ